MFKCRNLGKGVDKAQSRIWSFIGLNCKDYQGFAWSSEFWEMLPNRFKVYSAIHGFRTIVT